MAQTSTGKQEPPPLETLAKELENPMSKTWSLVFQGNLNLQQGNAVDGTVIANYFFFQMCSLGEPV